MDKFFVRDNKPSIYTETPWHFKTPDKKIYDTILKLVNSETKEGNGVLWHMYVYESEKGDRAKRMSFFIGDNVAFIYDIIDSAEDVSVYSDFVIQNGDLSAECNVADKSKLVIRESEIGIKHFRLSSFQNENSVIDKAGLLMPYKVKDNRDVVYSMYEGLYSYGKKHKCLFGFTADSLIKIPGWHFYETEKGWKACAPANLMEYEIVVSETELKINDLVNDVCIVDISI